MSTENQQAPQLTMLKDWQQDWVNHIYQDLPIGDLMKPIPSELYQYRRVSKYTLEQIENQTIHFSQPSSFNDPYDCFIQGSSIKNAVKAISNIEITDEEAEKGVKDFNKKRDDTFVSCLAKNKLIIPMWAHYADNGQGICIEFKIKESKLGIYPHPVFYTNKIDKIFTELAKFESQNFSKNLIDPSLKLLSILDLCKHSSWKYEQEWRYYAIERDIQIERWTQDGHHTHEHIPKAPVNRELPISAIYFGLKADDDSKAKIKKLVDGKNIELYQMKLSNKTFGLEAVSI